MIDQPSEAVPLSANKWWDSLSEPSHQFKIVAVDNPSLDISNTILPEAMLHAGERVMANNRNCPPDALREVAVEVFRAMISASPRFSFPLNDRSSPNG